MRIFGGVQANSAQVHRQPTELGRSEMEADIFNNRSTDSEHRKEVKVRLSHASQHLMQKFHEQVGGFLAENLELADALDKIEIPENGSISEEFLPVRKAALYLNWLRMQEMGEDIEGDSPVESYLGVHECGQDDALKAVFTEHNQERKEMQVERSRHAPSYYYLAYPEAYAFN